MQNNIKKIIVLATIAILGLGIFFGYKFYQASKNPTNAIDKATQNTDNTRTPFQTRISTSSDITTIIENQKNNVENPTLATTKKPRLIQIWKEPVSGFGFVTKDVQVFATSTDNSTSTILKKLTAKNILKNQQYVYFWDRKTGHIYENLASTTEVAKISNYTLPGVEEAFFVDSGSIIIRKLSDDNETITTRYVKLVKEFSSSTTYTTSDKDIDIGSKNIAVSNSAKRIFYFLDKTGKGTLSSLDGEVKTSAINTTLSEWLSQYVNKDLITLTTKPSAYFPGYLFSMRTDGTGKNTYILGDKYGFNTLTSPDGSKVIYSEIINNTLETYIYDIKSKGLKYLRQSTIVDKCTWSADSKKIYCAIPQKLYQYPYPDAWYKNEVSFVDNIWSIDPTTGDFTLVVPIQDQVATLIDVYKITVSPDNKYLLFQDKETLTLWKYDL